ncbi:RNA polymerase sigma factor (sigma-70 family) [Kitasatospora sp. MAP12-15]|uniref:sigma-70 family RNA polymerase sigma factor n=1 Tax=unclassified Kitasatospora TaxID=2633591 RepID=UPI002472F651|nr:sigma-70 family RNA polymerase sigma factor [Kitasatospora sp. MAP12-44]MDH6115022.1 RNA polymerase sigma factor (sigma-70 family) [Kitasatospora sp. MAP12-44]
MGHRPSAPRIDAGSGPYHQPLGQLLRRPGVTFSAFHEYHHKLWLRYAHTQVGHRAAALTVVEDACSYLLEHWEHALEQESVPEYAWTVLKEHVQGWLDERGLHPVLVGTAAFRSAIGKLLIHELRDQFTLLESELGLYNAIAALPDRQYDVIVVRYVLGYPDEEVAQYLGIGAATVRSHVRHAKRRLSKDLNLPEAPDREE